MGEKTIINKRALNSINNFYKIISEKGYPERAKKFTEDLYNFAYELTPIAESFSKCRHKNLAKKNFKCIPYKKNYIFIISVKDKLVTIHNIIPAKKIR